ncbi:hypothetical protein AHAS_Ahas19G0054800 [Arachis hypogaea]
MARQSEKETLILSSFDSAAQPREKEDERPSFSLGISPPASQPSLILSSMPTTASFLTKENFHRLHFYLSQFAMEGIGGCGLLM